MNFDKITSILEIINENNNKGITIPKLKKHVKIQGPILNYLIILEEIGFIERIKDELRYKPFSLSKWRITKKGKKFLKYFRFLFQKKDRTEEIEIKPKFLFVATVPSIIKIDDLREYQKFQLLDILEDLFSGATNEILLASPFIDKLIVHFLGKVKPGVRVNILTNETPRELKSTVIRLKSSYPNIKIKCLKEFSGDVQIYQLHAKFVCIDSKYVIITSANINERSLYYNIEIGIMIEDEKFGTEIRDFFYKLMNVSDEC